MACPITFLKHFRPQHTHQPHRIHLSLLAILRSHEDIPLFDEVLVVDLVDIILELETVVCRYAAFGVEDGIDEEFEEAGDLDAGCRRVVLLRLLLSFLLQVFRVLDSEEDVGTEKHQHDDVCGESCFVEDA